MTWDLPTQVQIGDCLLKIRNNCDYRVVLDVISAINDDDLRPEQKIEVALKIFYDAAVLETENITENILQGAISEMMNIINCGDAEEPVKNNKPRLMDWEQDFKWIAPPISRVLGYDVRASDKYTHWYSFIGAYMEIGDCTYNTIVSIRSKRAKGERLEKWELKFFNEHRKDVELKIKITAEEEMLLNSQW